MDHWSLLLQAITQGDVRSFIAYARGGEAAWLSEVTHIVCNMAEQPLNRPILAWLVQGVSGATGIGPAQEKVDEAIRLHLEVDFDLINALNRVDDRVIILGLFALIRLDALIPVTPDIGFTAMFTPLNEELDWARGHSNAYRYSSRVVNLLQLMMIFFERPLNLLPAELQNLVTAALDVRRQSPVSENLRIKVRSIAGVVPVNPDLGTLYRTRLFSVDRWMAWRRAYLDSENLPQINEILRTIPIDEREHLKALIENDPLTPELVRRDLQ